MGVLVEFGMFWLVEPVFFLFLSEMLFEGEQNRRISIVYTVKILETI